MVYHSDMTVLQPDTDKTDVLNTNYLTDAVLTDSEVCQ